MFEWASKTRDALLSHPKGFLVAFLARQGFYVVNWTLASYLKRPSLVSLAFRDSSFKTANVVIQKQFAPIHIFNRWVPTSSTLSITILVFEIHPVCYSCELNDLDKPCSIPYDFFDDREPLKAGVTSYTHPWMANLRPVQGATYLDRVRLSFAALVALRNCLHPSGFEL